MHVKAQRTASDKPGTQPVPERWAGSILDLEGIGHGISGMVLMIDDLRVIKVCFGTVKSKEDMETERKAYSILMRAKKPSPHLLKCFELDNPQGLILERCHETVRHRLRSIPEGSVPCSIQVQQWAKQAAEGLAFLHDHDVMHADVGCHNMLLDSNDVLKLCDFAGSSVEGSHASTNYELWSRLPSKGEGEPTRTSDLFALGSAMYEMSTKEIPYYKKSLVEVQRLYQRKQFPPVKNIVGLGNVIANCWLQKYTSASEVIYEIDPHRSVSCCVQDDPMKEPAHSPENAVQPSVTRDVRSKNPSSPPNAPSSSTRSSLSLSNTSLSCPFTSVSPHKSWNSSVFKKLSLKGTVHSHDREELADHKAAHREYFERASSKHNRNSTRRRTRHQSSLSQWINKSFQIYLRQPQ